MNVSVEQIKLRSFCFWNSLAAMQLLIFLFCKGDKFKAANRNPFHRNFAPANKKHVLAHILAQARDLVISVAFFDAKQIFDGEAVVVISDPAIEIYKKQKKTE